MSDAADATWDALEAEWKTHNTYRYKRTDIVALLREADRHVQEFIRAHPEHVATIQATTSGATTTAVAVEESFAAASSVRKRQRQEGAGEADTSRDNRDDGPSRRGSNHGDACQRESEAGETSAYDALLALPNEPAYEGLYKCLVKVQAPMVRFSRPAFRQLCRLWGTDISYTHMILAESCVGASAARHADFGVYAGEDKLVVQLAAKSGPTAARAASLLLPYCDAFDLNCGCPQRWAMKEGLGSALLKKPEIVADMVKCIRNAITDYKGNAADTSPTSTAAAVNNAGMSVAACVVKMRVDEDVRKSVEFARQVAAAGASWVTVHGRTPTDSPTARVRWETIHLIREELAKSGVPVVANGGVASPSAAALTAVATGTGAVMSANGLLDNPAMFHLPASGQAMLDSLTFTPRKRPQCQLPPPPSPHLALPQEMDGSTPFPLSLYDHLFLPQPQPQPHGEGREVPMDFAQFCEARERHQRRCLLSSVRPVYGLETSGAEFRPLWSLPTTPVEVVSDFLRASLHMDLPLVTTVQQTVRLARAYLSPTERVQLSYLKSNVAVLHYLDELGLYSDRGCLPLLSSHV